MKTLLNISTKRNLYLLPLFIVLLAFTMPACDSGSPSGPVDDPTPDPEPPPSADNRIEAIEETITDAMPLAGTPLLERNLLEEVRAVGKAMAELPDVDTVLVMEQVLTVQTVFNDGITHLFINNRPSGIDELVSSKPVPGLTMQGTPDAKYSSTPGNNTSVGGPPGSDRAVVISYDGGAEVAAEVRQMVSDAGYEVLDLGASLEDMRNYKNLGLLYLDTHGATFRRIVRRNPDGTFVTEGGAFGIQTSTIIDGSNLKDYVEDFEEGLLVWSIVPKYDVLGELLGIEETKLAITDKFIEKYWSFNGGGMVLHVCFVGAETDPSGNPVNILPAIGATGAKFFVGTDHFSWATVARPSFLHFFDRLLGANSYDPEDDPPLRPFDITQVWDDMNKRGLLIFRKPNLVFMGEEIGGNLVGLTFFPKRKNLERTILAPSIRNFDIEDDAAQEMGELTLNGSFGNTEGTVEVDGILQEIENWSEDQIVAKIPFTGPGSAGPVVVKAPEEVKSNEVPLTEWQGTITLTTVLEGSLKGEAVIDARFRADAHAFRKKLAEDAGHREVTTYLSPSSNGMSEGSGFHSTDGGTTTWFGDYEMKVLNKNQVDSKSFPPNSSVIGGKISINPDEEKAEICLGLRGKIGVRGEGARGTTETFVYDLFTAPLLLLADRTEIFYGCIDADLDGDSYVIEGEKRSGANDDGTATYTLEWTDFKPRVPPDDDTAG